jgi:hypothetical protein
MALHDRRYGHTAIPVWTSRRPCLAQSGYTAASAGAGAAPCLARGSLHLSAARTSMSRGNPGTLLKQICHVDSVTAFRHDTSDLMFVLQASVGLTEEQRRTIAMDVEEMRSQLAAVVVRQQAMIARLREVPLTSVPGQSQPYRVRHYSIGVSQGSVIVTAWSEGDLVEESPLVTGDQQTDGSWGQHAAFLSFRVMQGSQLTTGVDRTDLTSLRFMHVSTYICPQSAASPDRQNGPAAVPPSSGSRPLAETLNPDTFTSLRGRWRYILGRTSQPCNQGAIRAMQGHSWPGVQHTMDRC